MVGTDYLSKEHNGMIYDIHDHYGNYKGYTESIDKARVKAFNIVKGKRTNTVAIVTSLRKVMSSL